MQGQLRDRPFFLALLLLSLFTCYWVRVKYGFAVVAPPPPPNCVTCRCKDVKAWQVAGDPNTWAHGNQQQTQAAPPTYNPNTLTGIVNIDAIPNSCTNATGNTQVTPGIFMNWVYVQAVTTCANPMPPQEMSFTDAGTPKVQVKNILNCN